MSNPIISIDNALQEYYKLKDQYDKTYDSKKHAIISDITIPYSKKKVCCMQGSRWDYFYK